MKQQIISGIGHLTKPVELLWVLINMDIAATAQSVQGKVVGVIIPPPEIRAVVDKTAQFVAKHGKSFEQKILNSNEGKTAKFNFMKELDPYHAYYEMKIREIEEAIAAGKDPNAVTSKPIAAALPITAVKANDVEKKRVAQVSSNVRPSILNPVALLAKNPPKEAPYPLEFSLSQPSGVSAAEIDIIKLTAQYTAVNGREFLAALAQREQRNPMFDFLKPTHLLFGLFTSLVDAYVKVANPTETLRNRVKQRQNRQFVLETCVQRWSWIHAEAERQQSSQNQDDVERLAFQNIDWNDFAVVEVINFDENELLDLPGLTPVTESDVQAAIGRRMPPPPPPPPPSTNFPSPEHGPPPPPPLPPTSTRVDNGGDEMNGRSNEDEDDEDAIKVVSDFKPRIVGSTSVMSGPAMTIDPITGRAIPVDQLQEHMRIQLLDPKWKEEQKRFQEKQSGYSGSLGTTEGDTIAESLKLLAKKRGDIFGQSTAAVGVDSARRIAEAEMREQQQFQTTSSLQWDGNTASAASVLAKREEISSTLPTTQGSVYSAYHAGVTVTAQGPALMPPPPVAPTLPANISSVPLSIPPPPPPLPMVAPPVGLPIAPPLVPLTPAVPVGLAPPPPPPLPLSMALPLGMMPPHATAVSAAMTVVVTGQSTVEQPPSAKRPRMTEEDTTTAEAATAVPAEEFAKLHPGPIVLRVSLPMDTSAGQTVELSLSNGVLTTVKEVKEQLAAQFLSNMPVNKLQLKSAQIGFWKDVSTLASLNVAGGSGVLVEASLKSRGGKR